MTNYDPLYTEFYSVYYKCNITDTNRYVVLLSSLIVVIREKVSFESFLSTIFSSGMFVYRDTRVETVDKLQV